MMGVVGNILSAMASGRVFKAGIHSAVHAKVFVQCQEGGWTLQQMQALKIQLTEELMKRDLLEKEHASVKRRHQDNSHSLAETRAQMNEVCITCNHGIVAPIHFPDE